MMKKFTQILTLAFFMLVGLNTQAQLADGSIVPDFMATDIDGNEHHLYEYLDEGKIVILDVSATWCGPCWSYMETGVLEDIHDEYGPEGTDEIVVLFIEGDPGTTDDDLNGTGGNTIGDWVSNINYPIIDGTDGADLATLLEIGYYPTMYTVYPNRTIIESGQQTVDGHIALTTEDNYLVPGGANNAGILGLTSSPVVCGDAEPAFRVQNLGSDNLTSATLELVLDGAVVETMEWSGNLAQYEFEDVAFDALTIEGASDIELNLTMPNGMMDEDDNGNTVAAQFVAPVYSSSKNITLTLTSDNYPQEVTVEILDPSGTVVASWIGANGDFAAGTPTTIDFSEVDLTVSGCHNLRLFDSFGDGISLGGTISLENDGLVLYDDANFTVGATTAGSEVLIPFNVALTTDAAIDLGVTSALPATQTLTCDDSMLGGIAATVANFGQDNLTAIDLTLSINGDDVQTINWTGSLATGESEDVTFDDVDLSAYQDELMIEINASSSNGSDANEDNNIATSVVTLPKVSPGAVAFSITTDKWPEEVAFEVKDADGTVVFSNADLGTLECETTYDEMFDLAAGCYTFSITDGYGDGLFNSESVNPDSHTCTNGDPAVSLGALSLTTSDGVIFFDNNEYGMGTDVFFTITEGGTGPVAPSAAISGDVDNSTYTATGSSDDADASYAWSVTDANGDEVASGTDADFSYEFSMAGEYTVTLTVTGANGLMTETSENIVIEEEPVAPTADISGGVDNITYTGTGSSDDANATYAWSITDAEGEEVATGETADISADLEFNGDYTLTMTVTGSNGLQTVTTENFAITAGTDVGIADIAGLNSVALFPVPAQNQLTIQLDLNDAKDMQISITNILGETVEVINQTRFNAGENMIQVNTAAYSNGLYLINIETEANVASQRFVVSK